MKRPPPIPPPILMLVLGALAYGVAHSQNAILGKLAYQKLDPKTLEAEARALGWLDSIPLVAAKAAGALELPAERDLEFARAAAGFKGAKLSVLGGALLTATFAAQGEQPKPRLVAAIDGTPVVAPPARRAISAEAARAVGKMMIGTCDGGSANKSFGAVHRKGLTVAGKTGTLTKTDPFYIEHSSFVGYAPAEKPEIVVSVLLGNPENWHLRGHEAARRGLNPNLWFGNVERVVSERIGRETVQYVGNIYKYYVAYRLVLDRDEARQRARERLTDQ
jgi:cell division protein FtsI/penicillin-binding protein 2